MLIVVFITQLLFILIFLTGYYAIYVEKDKETKKIQAELADCKSALEINELRPSFAEGLVLGEEEALKNHQKVLDAYRRLFPNAK